MKASDTVIKAREFEILIQHIHGRKFPTTEEELGSLIADVCRRPVEAQAEITWKAREPEIAEARKAGIKEVVEWINSHSFSADPWNYYEFSEKEWQAFLKKKGIDQS